MSEDDTAANLLRTAAENQDTRTLTKALFNYNLAPFQAKIVREVAYGLNQRVAITAPTQTGKSRAVALGISLLLTSHPGPLTVSLVAPKQDQAKKIRTYFGEHVSYCPLLAHQLETAQGGDPKDRLMREASRERVTLQGGKEFTTHTAGGSLMSQGCDVLIIEEAGEMTMDQHAQARRMAAGSVEDGEWSGREINIGNPWPQSPFEEIWNDPDYVTYQTTWEQAVTQGRLSEEFVQKERERLDDLRFTVYYESRFPEQADNALYRGDWIQRATQPHDLELDDDAGQEVYALDVAEGGADQNVLAHGTRYKHALHVHSLEVWDEADTKRTTRRVRRLVPPGSRLIVDALGVGKGVADDLKSPDEANAPRFKVTQFKASRKPKDKDYANRFTELAYRLRSLLEDERVLLPDHDRLLSELRRARTDLGGKRIRVTFKGNKSPDCADAVIMLLDTKARSSAWTPL